MIFKLPLIVAADGVDDAFGFLLLLQLLLLVSPRQAPPTQVVLSQVAMLASNGEKRR